MENSNSVSTNGSYPSQKNIAIAASFSSKKFFF